MKHSSHRSSKSRKSRWKPSWFATLLLLFVFISALAISPLGLQAQVAPSEAAKAPESDAAGQQQRPAQSAKATKRDPHHRSGQGFLSPRTERSDNLVAAENEDDEAVYRHSPSVRAIGRWLHLGPEQAARLFEYLNFAILAGGILFLLLKYLPAMMRDRRETIQKQLLEARAATEQANSRLAAVEQRFARLDQEIAGIRTQAEQESALEETRIRSLMEAERQRIVSSAEQEIAAAASAARRELKRFAGELAIDRAVKRISLDDAGDRVLMRQFVQELGDEPRWGGQN